MHWEIEIQSAGTDREQERVSQEYDLLANAITRATIVRQSARGYLLPGTLERIEVERLVRELFLDPLVETAHIREVAGKEAASGNGRSSTGQRGPCGVLTVLLKPGVMDPVTLSVVEAAKDLQIALPSIRTFRRYYLEPVTEHRAAGPDPALLKVLTNDAIEQAIEGPLGAQHLWVSQPYVFRRVTVPLLALDREALLRLSREGQLALTEAEMQAIQGHFRELGRDPSDVELETIAQTWSEHCSHKTLKGPIHFNGQRIENLLGETIFAATREIRRRLSADDWCVSVFEDNAGIVRFNDRFNVCFKVETHNHPSAIEPYGGANTGVGGVVRDPLGTGLGAWPICNTDVFCFAPPDTPPESLPPGVLHPRQVIRGVVAGERDYGNRMGIPTVNGAVCFDPRYLGNPLVYCGTVGLIPVEHCRKGVEAGDRIVVIGGRTGRDGIHGATFSSLELTADSESVSGGAVQIGNAITEKKLLDVIVQARDRGLYHAITDCGAGGFSSAVGEMAERLGAEVHLERAPLKYEGLSYAEIWISESQERMVLAVPPESWDALQALCASEDVEATAIGSFEATGRLRLFYGTQPVADLGMDFLHHGRPALVRQASWSAPMAARTSAEPTSVPGIVGQEDFTSDVCQILASYDVCSKEWIVRQYDHEVQGGTVIKPLVGIALDGPGDATVLAPVLGSSAGLAVGCGINPNYGDLDPYWMAVAVVDEAARNVVAVGADPARVALLDNFCWGNTDRPEVLGSLVRAAQGCRDAALAYGMPFISGKDSLYNEYRSGDHRIAIPGTLLISALGFVPDVRRCVTMDLKAPGNRLYLVGQTRNELGGSRYGLLRRLAGGSVPQADLTVGARIFAGIHAAIRGGLVRACHDLSEGGLAVAVAEMAFAGGIGAELSCPRPAGLSDEAWLFSESPTRFLVEVMPENAEVIEDLLGDKVPWTWLGQTHAEPRLRIAGAAGAWSIDATLEGLKNAWQEPLRW